MYNEYTIYTLQYTHSMQRTCFLYSLYIVHTDSQLYFDKYKICVQKGDKGCPAQVQLLLLYKIYVFYVRCTL